MEAALPLAAGWAEAGALAAVDAEACAEALLAAGLAGAGTLLAVLAAGVALPPQAASTAPAAAIPVIRRKSRRDFGNTADS